MITIGRHVSRLSGYAPALPTPFTDQGEVDGAAFEHFCDLQIRLAQPLWSSAAPPAKRRRCARPSITSWCASQSTWRMAAYR